jgi:endonuclease/exonuclease/phosphatase family metal-dependent hydrolase
MNLVSYNILDGGVGRADPIAEVIEARRPDVVVLVEADDVGVVERIARRLGMDVASGRGAKHGIAVMSGWEMRESIDHGRLDAEFEGCFLETTIRSPGGNDLVVVGAHLHARARETDERRREEQVDVMLGRLARHRESGQAHILCGDLNSNSPVQKIDIDRCKPRTREDWEANGGSIPRRAVTKLLEAGYVDTLYYFDPEMAATLGSFTTRHPGQRVDYVLTHSIEPGRIRDAWIERDRLAQFASDHYPVGVRIEWE